MKINMFAVAGMSAVVMLAQVGSANAQSLNLQFGSGNSRVNLNLPLVAPSSSRGRTPAPRRTYVCASTCQQNKDMQAALNHFGYNAGPVDGVPGGRTRSAIRTFESQMGLYADSTLDQTERSFLMSAYHRSQSGNYGPHYQAYSSGGNAGFLRSLNQERLGQFTGGNSNVYGDASVPGRQPSQIPGTQPVHNRGPQLGGPNNPGNFVGTAPMGGEAVTAASPWMAFDVAPVSQSMNTHCTETQQLTVTNGGYIQAASTGNAAQALSEQFCLAREFSDAKGQQMIGGISGLTASDVSARCQEMATNLKPAMEALTTQARSAVVRQVQQIAGQMGPQGMVQAGQICLGVGYSEDDPNVALTGALLLAAGGQDSYGEIVGHHLREGFGVMANPELAKSWHLETISAMEAGAPAVILPSQAGQRNAVIRAAYGANAAQAAMVSASNVNVNAGGSLPTFVVAPTQ